ncbi:MAG: hypothetical protein KDI28_04505 [Pseudomonadales bacterium]|nr:hypothetical protein [Pseudomonadales bacterium]
MTALPMNPIRRLALATLCLLLGTPSMAAENSIQSERLWLPASASELRPFLQMAVDMALQDENCKDILYARLNEYRTIYEEPTFTILCQKDPKTTFNRVIKITEVDPEYFDKIRASENALDTNRTLSPEIEALRRQLGAPAAPAQPTTGTPAPTAEEDNGHSAEPAAPAAPATSTPPAASH